VDEPLELPSRVDALPEHVEYRDTGCDLYPSCLRCPLVRCRFDDPGGAAGILRSGRDASILRLSHEQGVCVDELAAMFGLSRRTIFRVLQQGRGTRRG